MGLLSHAGVGDVSFSVQGRSWRDGLSHVVWLSLPALLPLGGRARTGATYAGSGRGSGCPHSLA